MLTVEGLPELRAAVRLFGECGKPIRRELDRESRAWAPTLAAAARRRAAGEVEGRIAASARTSVSGKGPRVVFGSSGKVGDTPLREVTRPYEFGAPQRATHTTVYLSRHRTSRKAMRVERHTHRQLPRYQPKGRFLYPAVAETAPDLVGRWVRAVVRVMTDA